MRKLAFSIRGYFLVPFVLFFLSTAPALGQGQVITKVWSETGGVFATKFGIPTATDANGNLYRAGLSKNGLNGTDAELQKIDNQGELLWSVTLNTSSVNYFEPSKVYEESNFVYVTGIVTYLSNGETDFFVSKVDQDGNVEWFVLDETDDNDVASDIIYDATSSSVYICGTSERGGTYDLMVASYDDGDGTENWLETRDYDSHIDLGVKISIDGNLIISGSSQPTATSWDIVTWEYTTAGVFDSENRNNGTSTSSDQLADGVLENNYIFLTGKSLQGTNGNDFKVICLDANNNLLWLNSFDKNNLEDEGLAVTASSNSFVATGYVTDVAGNSDIVTRKYNLSGTLLWSTETDKHGEDDKGVDVIEDDNGNFLVLSEVMLDGQSDVYIHCYNSGTGSLIWSEAVGNDQGLNEHAISLEASFDNEVLVTYEVNNLPTTVSYSYADANFSEDDEPFSTNVLYIANSGQLKYENGQSAMDFRYYTQGMKQEMYFEDDGFSALVVDNPDQIQRIDFDFVNASATNVGQVEDYEKETHFNFYDDQLKYEQQGTFDVIGYPNIYSNIDAFMSSNSEGFKLTFVLQSGADIGDIELDINGGSGIALSSGSNTGGNLEIYNFSDDIVWLEPYSYFQEEVEISSDGCVDYDITNGNVKLTTDCAEMAYPYVIQLKVGTGISAGVSKIDNLYWSTFYGGNGNDGAFDVDVDGSGNLYVVGFTASTRMPPNSMISPQTLTGDTKGLLISFDHNGVIRWANAINGTPTNMNHDVAIKGVGVYDNITAKTGEEVHIVGEYLGDMSPSYDPAFVPSTAYQQTISSNSQGTDLFFASFDNSTGARLMQSPFGGEYSQVIFGMDISDGGIMYFSGSTEKGGVANSSSQTPPTSHTFPLYNPGDGSYYHEVFAGGGTRGFVSAIDLSTYALAYSSIIDDYAIMYDIQASGFAAFCGQGLSNAKLGFFDPSARLFATTLSQTNSDWADIDYFSSVTTAELGNVFFGINTKKAHKLQTAASGNTFSSTAGDAYLVRFFESSLQWDTYYANTSEVKAPWTRDYSFYPYLHGKGKLAYNSSTNTFFAAGSASGNSVQTKSRSGFFTESSNATVGGIIKADLFLAAFSNDPFNKNALTWATMYGGQNGGGGLSQDFGKENLGDLVTYDHAGDSWLVTVGSSTSFTGSTTSDIDKYPVANPGGGASFLKDNFGIANSIVISKFKVTDVDQGISIDETTISNKNLNIFPNPTDHQVIIRLKDSDIETIEIYNLSGQSIFNETYQGRQTEVKLDVSGFPKGVYLVEINGFYNSKILKL